MPRDLPLGNGSLLIALDAHYQIRDLYWPYVGQENHAVGHPFRVGVWMEGKFSWLEEEGWQRSLRYQPETLVTDVALEHPGLQLTLKAADVVDFHENLLVRRFDITNRADHNRVVTLFFQHDFHIAGNEVGDTSYYEPERRAVFHYKGAHWFLINGAIKLENGDPGPGWEPTPDTAPGLVVGVHQWACGLKEIHNLQGTWRDAEDGRLSGSVVAHGSVDSTVGFSLSIPPGDSRRLFTWLAIAKGFGGVAQINRLVRQRGPQFFLDRGAAYWRLWLNSQVHDLGDLPPEVVQLYKRSLLIILTQIDKGGAIIAANDSDVSSDVRDTYSYMWSRDGALVADALDMIGYLDIPREFFQFCDRVKTREGFLLHKYNPDGTLASSWHPWSWDGHKDLPIQEDETALVVWALWRHFKRYGDVFFIKPLYRTLICPIGDFLTSFRDLDSGLPLPSYDLWEERRGILSWTVAAIWGGLMAAANFATAFGEMDRAQRYLQAASEIKAGAENDLWQPQLNCFARMITRGESGAWQIDQTIDASLVGLWKFGMYAPDDPKVVATMQVVRDRLWVKTPIGGLARFEGDRYHQASSDTGNVPGNPWFICTLWLAEWYAAIAKSREDLQPALDLLKWVANHALSSGVLAEQLHPYTGEPLSVSPLTWSHAEYITSMQAYLQARRLW